MANREPEQRSPKEAIAQLDRDLKRIDAKRRGGGFWGRVRRWLLILVIAAVVGPPAWVLLYRFVEAPGTILMVKRFGEGESIARHTVRLKDISPHLVRAVIAAEDSRFCEHDGFDVEAIQAALASNQKQEGKKRPRIRGGSTISQQTAKNLFLWPERSWVRKGAEAYFTVLIEAAWPKSRIMEAYLNAAEWGDGRFGAEAAARELFGKSAKDLTPREAARLAAILPSPNKWRADQPGPYVRRRAATIEQRMGVVRREGLDACARPAGAAAPAPERTPKGEKPKPAPKLEPLPAPPTAEAPLEPSIAEAASAAVREEEPAPPPDAIPAFDGADAPLETAPEPPPADAPVDLQPREP